MNIFNRKHIVFLLLVIVIITCETCGCLIFTMKLCNCNQYFFGLFHIQLSLNLIQDVCVSVHIYLCIHVY